jgi:hypothetical protein
MTMKQRIFSYYLVGGLFVLLAGCTGSGGNSFDWTLTPRERRIAPGAEATFDIKLKSKENINSTVRFSATNAPTNATATFDVHTLPSTGDVNTLRVQTAANTPLGTWEVNVTAEEIGHSTHTKQARVIVETSSGQPDFSLEVEPDEDTLTGSSSTKTFTFYVRPLNGFQGTVDIAVTGVADPLYLTGAGPTPAHLTYQTGDGGKGGTFVLYSATEISADPTITVTATSGSLSHSRQILLHLRPGTET